MEDFVVKLCDEYFSTTLVELVLYVRVPRSLRNLVIHRMLLRGLRAPTHPMIQYISHAFIVNLREHTVFNETLEARLDPCTDAAVQCLTRSRNAGIEA